MAASPPQPPPRHVGERTPHYSRVEDLVENINPVTGRSIFYGLRPWRCDDRLQDFMLTFLRLDGFRNLMGTWKVLWRCGRSEDGNEPTTDYNQLSRREVMFYVDRLRVGMIRGGYFERYPYAARDVGRVIMEDGTKMRVWRHQRELEMEIKAGRIDELLATNVMASVASRYHTPDKAISSK